MGLTHGFILNYFGLMSVAEIIIFLGLLTNLRNTIDSSLYSFYFIKAASIGDAYLEIMSPKPDLLKGEKKYANFIMKLMISD